MENRNWKAFKLGKVTTKIGSGSTPTGGSNAYKDEGISLIRSQNVLDFTFSNDGLAFIDDEQAFRLRGVTVEENDILFNITGDSVARVCKVPSQILPARVNQHVAILRADNINLHYDFLLYLMQSKKEELLIMSEIGATRNAITKVMLENLEIQLPPLPEQKAIASVLSSLDDKIDLLHQQNQTLEALAETLFRQWFIEEAKEDWEEVPLKDLVKLLQGKYVSAEKISEAINLDQKFPLYGGNGIRGYLNTYQFKERKVAITCRGNGCGLIQLLNPFSNISNSCIVLNNDENLSIWFIYYYSKTLDFFSVTSGSAQPQITITDIGTLNITIPDIEILVKFDKIVKSYHDKIFENQQQIQTLTQLRDTLLPKLMSGEVRVKM